MKIPFQAPISLRHALLNLKSEYEKNTEVILDDSPSPSLFSKTFGRKDVPTRKRQFELLKAVAMMNNGDKYPSKESCVLHHKLMIALAYLTYKDIESNYSTTVTIKSEAYKLLKNALGLDHQSMDQKTLNECMAAFKSLSHEQLSTLCKKAKVSDTTFMEHRELMEKTDLHINKDYLTDETPCASVLSKVGSFATRSVFWGTGFAVGQAIGKTSATAPMKALVTAGLGALFVWNPLIGGGATAAMVFARPLGETSVEYSTGYAIATLSGKAGSAIGRKVGWGIGKTLDVAASGVTGAYNMISDSISQARSEIEAFVGIDIHSGALSANYKLPEDELRAKLEEIARGHDAKGEEHHSAVRLKLSETEKALLPSYLELFSTEHTFEKEAPSTDRRLAVLPAAAP